MCIFLEILISKFWLGVRIYWTVWVSDDESEFTDSKASLNQFEPIWLKQQNLQSEFLIIFQNFKILTYLSL